MKEFGVNTGAYPYRVTVQVKTPAQDSFGGPTETWADLFTDWGGYEPLGSREFPAANKRNAEATCRWRLLFRRGVEIDPSLHRIVTTMDHTASPPVEQIWNIYPVELVGRPVAREWLIEASEVK